MTHSPNAARQGTGGDNGKGTRPEPFVPTGADLPGIWTIVVPRDVARVVRFAGQSRTPPETAP